MTTIVPPPWQLTGSGTILLYRFPRGWVLERGFVPDELRDTFAGGLGAVMLVSYSASGVGPYHEALFIPGQFELGGRRRYVITRIFVSTLASVDSGRANWGIPKERADFEVAGDSFRASLGGDPLLDAHVAAFGPTLPVDSRWSPLPLELGQIHARRLFVTRPSGRGAVRLARLRRMWTAQAHFPDVSSFRPLLAARATGFTLTFPLAEVSVNATA